MSIFLPFYMKWLRLKNHGSWFFSTSAQRHSTTCKRRTEPWEVRLQSGIVSYSTRVLEAAWGHCKRARQFISDNIPAWQHLRNQTCHFDDSKYDADENGGADNLAALHRSYKMMENDKVRYMEESKNIIKRQTQVDSPCTQLQSRPSVHHNLSTRWQSLAHSLPH